MHAYSPTQTDLHAFCPQARQFYREGWDTRIADKPMIARWIGSAMSAGLAEYYGAFQGRAPVEVAKLEWETLIEAFRRQNGAIDDADVIGIPALIEKVFTRYTKIDPIPSTWRVVAAEYELKDSGRSRPDLIVETPNGLANVDFKWKKSLYTKSGETVSQARGRTLLEYENYWNMLHYHYFLRQEFGVEKCSDKYYIVLGELTPSPHVTLQEFVVSEAVLAQWEHTARHLWADIDCEDEEAAKPDADPPRGNTSHKNQYGLCKYYDACFRHFGDRESMQTQYIQLERRHEHGSRA